MKKTILILGIGGIISLASCKKEHTCECTVSFTETITNPFTGETETESGSETGQEVIEGSKKDARADCEADNGTTGSSGNSTTIDCKLI